MWVIYSKIFSGFSTSVKVQAYLGALSDAPKHSSRDGDLKSHGLHSQHCFTLASADVSPSPASSVLILPLKVWSLETVLPNEYNIFLS